MKRSGKMLFIIAILLAGTLLPAGQVSAQPMDSAQKQKVPYHDSTMQKFVQAMKEIQKINREAEHTISKRFKDSSLDYKEYQKMTSEMIKKVHIKKGDFSDKDMETYKQGDDIVKQVRKESKQKAHEAIRETGLTVEAFDKMVARYKRSTVMQAKVREMY